MQFPFLRARRTLFQPVRLLPTEPNIPLFVLGEAKRSEAGAVNRRPAVGQISGEAFFERAGATDVPAAHPVDQPLQFEFSVADNPNGEGWSDDRIQLAVMTALHWDLAVPRNRVQVKVDHGWVTLTGKVRRDYEKSRAEADAQMIRGVAGVINEIDCAPV
jgi:osmotically-inducible protein OsmY